MAGLETEKQATAHMWMVVVVKLVHDQMGFVEHVAVKIATVDHTAEPAIVNEIVWVVGNVVVRVVALVDHIVVKIAEHAFVIEIVLGVGYAVERIAHADHIVANSMIAVKSAIVNEIVWIDVDFGMVVATVAAFGVFAALAVTNLELESDAAKKMNYNPAVEKGQSALQGLLLEQTHEEAPQ